MKLSLKGQELTENLLRDIIKKSGIEKEEGIIISYLNSRDTWHSIEIGISISYSVSPFTRDHTVKRRVLFTNGYKEIDLDKLKEKYDDVETIKKSMDKEQEEILKEKRTLQHKISSLAEGLDLSNHSLTLTLFNKWNMKLSSLSEEQVKRVIEALKDEVDV